MVHKLRDGVCTAEVEYGIALLDEERGEFWALNPTGALILQTLLGGATFELAARAVTEQFDVDVETAGEHVRDLVDDLCSAGLLQRRP